MIKEKLVGLFYTITVNYTMSSPMVVFEEKLKDTSVKCKEKSLKLQLEELLDYADSINDISIAAVDDYVEAKWDNFIYFREIVRNVLKNKNSSDDEIESAKWQIKYVMDELCI